MKKKVNKISYKAQRSSKKLTDYFEFFEGGSLSEGGIEKRGAIGGSPDA